MGEELRCPECAGAVSPSEKHPAIEDDAGRWFHLPCARERLTRQDRGIFLNPDELSTFAWCAVNYGLGRTTYITGEICRVLGRLVRFLSPGARAPLIREIAKAEERGELGMECDAREWLMLAGLLEESK